MGADDKTPVERGPQPPRRQTPAQSPPVHHTNPYGLPQWPPQPWLMPPPAEPKKDPLIPEWLKFLVSAVGAVVLVSTIVWKGGAIVTRFETLEKKFDEQHAQQEQRDKQRDEAAKLRDGIVDRALQDLNRKLGSINVTGRNRGRRATVAEPEEP